MCGEKYGISQKLFCFLFLLLFLASLHCEVVLTEEEYQEVIMLIGVSETELQIAKAEQEKALKLSNQALMTLEKAQSVSEKALSTQAQVLTLYNEQEIYWKEQRKELERELFWWKVGGVTIGITGLVTFIISVVRR